MVTINKIKTTAKKTVFFTFEFVKRLCYKFRKDHCLIRATGLAFASLLALVPLSALLFSLFSALGSFSDLIESLQSFLIKQLIPTSQEEIMSYINQVIDNTQALGVVGLLFFLVTSVILLGAIQSNFNAVWGSKFRKNSLWKLATYVSILIVGSFLISIGLHLTGMIRSLVTVSAVEELSRSLSFLLGIFPSLFIFIALLLMIIFIPTDRIMITSAIIGAAAGTILWETARIIFQYWVKYVLRLSLIYGSLAVIPIFLIWLYVAWTIVLFSLELTYVHQYRQNIWIAKPPEQMNPAERFLFGLEVYLFIADRFYKGKHPPTLSEISKHLSVPVLDIAFYADIFKHEKLLLTGDDEALIPSRSLDRIMLKEICESLFGNPPKASWQSEEVRALFQKVTNTGMESIENISVRGFFKSGNAENDSPQLNGALVPASNRVSKLESVRVGIRELWKKLFKS